MRKLAALLSIATVPFLLVATASGAPPTVTQFQDVFVDVNPCTGDEQTITINVTFYEPVFGVAHATHTISTSAGFVGRGEEVDVFHSNTFIANDVLFNPDTGQRIHAQLVVIANPATGDLQVFRQELTCIPPG